MSKKHKCSWWGSNQVPLVYECETLVNDLFFTYISMKSQKLLGKCLENIITLPPGQNSQVGPPSQDAFFNGASGVFGFCCELWPEGRARELRKFVSILELTKI